MLTILRSTRLTRLARRTVRRTTAAGAMALAGLLAACSGDSDPVAPGTGNPAHVAFRMQVQANAQTTEVRVLSRYLLNGGGYAALSSQTITLSDAPTQQVPISLDLASCLRDANRAGLSGAPAADECLVQLELELMLDGVVVDRQVLGPFSLRPGQTNTVTEPVALSDIANITITAPPGNVVAPGQPLRMEVATSMALTAVVSNGSGQPVQGRTPTWVSSAPHVATVNASGVVTAVAPGTVRIAAELGNRVEGVDVRVVPGPQVLTIQSSGLSGGGTLTSSPAGINCTITGDQATGACSFTFPGDASVVLTATPSGSSEHIGWAGACSGASGETCTVSMDQARLVGVVFRGLRTLTVLASGTGTGTVVSEVGGIACQAAAGVTTGTCSVTFREGASVLLTATASGTSSFRGWTGDCANPSAANCTLVMNTSRTVTARFETPVSVSVSGVGNGAGLVTSQPEGINCQMSGQAIFGNCLTTYPEGTSVTLTASATSGNTFRGWTGPCAATTGPVCTFTVSSSNGSVGANFSQPSQLTITTAGLGGGQVLSTPTGIVCVRYQGITTGNCGQSYPAGTEVTLHAQANAQSVFTGWSGACSGTGDCVLTMDESKTVTANYGLPQVPVTLRLTGAVGGSVSLNGAPACTLEPNEGTRICTVSTDLGTVATLSGAANGNGTVSFSGPCNTYSGSCQFTVGVQTTVLVTFGPPANILTIRPDAGVTGTGEVYSDDQSVNCQLRGQEAVGTCEAIVQTGGTVFLNAKPAGNSIFEGWSGACSAFGTADRCYVTPQQSLTAVARFTPGIQIVVNMFGSGGGTLYIASDDKYVMCTREPNTDSLLVTPCVFGARPGETVWISPYPDSISYFTGFSYPCPVQQDPEYQPETCMLQALAPVTLSAGFNVYSYSDYKANSAVSRPKPPAMPARSPKPAPGGRR